MHVKTRIRLAVLALLRTKLSTIEQRNVFDARLETLQDPLELPCLCVYAGNETAALEGASNVYRRALEVVVEACFKDSGDLDLIGEAIQEDVETALGGPGLDLGGAKSIGITDVKVERDSLEKPAARWRMTFVASYYTARGAPGVAQ